MSRPRVGFAFVLLLTTLSALPACSARKRSPPHETLAATAEGHDLLALSDALESRIAAGEDTLADREYAYEIARQHDEDTAPATFARAAITGRLVQLRGLRMANLIGEVEEYARRSRQIDPQFRDGAATRLLGTLYVVAPASLLKHGNSETGLELLEGLVTARPEVLENHLRLAEAYVALGDPLPAHAHLCRCLEHAERLRPDDQALLRQLTFDAGLKTCP